MPSLLKAGRRSLTSLTCVISMVAVADLEAQGIDGEILSVAEILEQQRRGYGPVAGGGLREELTEHPERWPRARLDSLSEGLTELLLEGTDPHPAIMFGHLTVEAADGRPVGTLQQFLTIVRAAPRIGMVRATPLKMIGHFPEDPRAIALLRRIVVSTDMEREFNLLDRYVAIRGLARSERGRGVLRALYERDVVPDREARHYLGELARQGFRLDPGGERLR